MKPEERRCYVCDRVGAVLWPNGVPYCLPCSPPPTTGFYGQGLAEQLCGEPKSRVVALTPTAQEVVGKIIELATKVYMNGGKPAGAILGRVVWAKLRGAKGAPVDGEEFIEIWTPSGGVKCTLDPELPAEAIHVVDQQTWDALNLRWPSALVFP